MDEKTISKIHQLGNILGITENEIDGIINGKTNVFTTQPSICSMDIYKIPGKYGTISPKDFQ